MEGAKRAIDETQTDNSDTVAEQNVENDSVPKDRKGDKNDREDTPVDAPPTKLVQSMTGSRKRIPKEDTPAMATPSAATQKEPAVGVHVFGAENEDELKNFDPQVVRILRLLDEENRLLREILARLPE